MTVIILHRYPPSLAGLLSRWMIQVSAGVFVASMSDRVRERVFAKVQSYQQEVNGVLCYDDKSIQGLRITPFGNPLYSVEDFDGLHLIVKPLKGSRRKS